MASNRVSSILTADFGSVQTRVVLFDVVEGEYRVVAHEQGRTTLGYPDDDLNVGLRRLLNNMTATTGRQFHNQIGRVVTPEDRHRNGVDYFITTASAGRPIRAIVVGLVPDISVASALRALSGTYVEVVAEFHLRDGYSDEDRLNAMIIGRPDLVFVSGGSDGGAVTALEDILHSVELGLKIQDEELRPPVLYAGNKQLQSIVNEVFGELTDVLISDNIRPTMERETIDSAQVALAKAYDEHRETHGEAFVKVSEMSSTGLLPTAQSYGLVAEYFAKTKGGNIIAVDVGSTSSVLVGSFNGQTNTQISTTKGLGQSAVTLVDDVGVEAIAEWLPYYPKGQEIRNYALNKLARPASIPMNLRDMFMEQAMIRVAVRNMVSESRKTWKGVAPAGYLPSIDTIIVGGGALNGTGHPAYDMVMVAECIQPIGVTEIKADRLGIIPPMNALARVQPDAVVQILDGNNLEHLGTLISLEGHASKEGIAAKLEIITDEEPVKYDLKVGEVLSLPLPHSFSLTIKIRCQSGFKVNGKSRLKLTLTGGTAGIIIDARGRNLIPPATVEERMRVLPQWISSATDDEVMELPEIWAIDENIPVRETKLNTMEAPIVVVPDALNKDIDHSDDDDEFDITSFFEEDEEDDDNLGSLRDLID